MVKDNESRDTPEKQLLKLIEDPNANNVDSAQDKYRAKRTISIDFIKGWLSFLSGKNKELIEGKHEIAFDIQFVNKLLKICITIIAGYLIIYIGSSMQSLKATPKFFSPALSEGKESEMPEARENLKPVSYYIDRVNARDIFNPFGKMKEVQEEAPVDEKKQAVNTEIEDFKSSLTIVGIAWSEEPEVIIENAKINRTFFLKRGDTFCDATVEAIFQDRVILKYKDEEIELR